MLISLPVAVSDLQLGVFALNPVSTTILLMTLQSLNNGLQLSMQSLDQLMMYCYSVQLIMQWVSDRT